MIVKLHHVLIDGVGGIGLLPLIVDFGPELRDSPDLQLIYDGPGAAIFARR